MPLDSIELPINPRILFGLRPTEVSCHVHVSEGHEHRSFDDRQLWKIN